MDLRHPVGKRQLKLQCGVVVFQRFGVLALFVKAFANHRVVTDRIDPAAIGGSAAETQVCFIAFQGVLVVAVVKRADVVVVHRHGEAAAADVQSANRNLNRDPDSNLLPRLDHWLRHRLIGRHCPSVVRPDGRHPACHYEGNRGSSHRGCSEFDNHESRVSQPPLFDRQAKSRPIPLFLFFTDAISPPRFRHPVLALCSTTGGLHHTQIAAAERICRPWFGITKFLAVRRKSFVPARR